MICYRSGYTYDRFLFQWTKLDSNNAYSFPAPDRIQLAAGASASGSPTVYYDHVTLERIR